uniref:STAS domain-containing protein n=1 Tax=Thaumasiovibrio occultus TaxID=1891184 RepID=UPI000B352714|nr:STAS domain-containing protein [Thaumasiovibrio occultus]
MKVQLTRRLEISGVYQETARYAEWLQKNDELEIDASLVERVDAAGIQALTTLFVNAKEAGKRVFFCALSPKLDEAIRILELDALFYGAPLHAVSAERH